MITDKQQRDKNNLRKKARRKAIKEGKVKVGEKRDVDHKKPLSKGGTNASSNLRLLSINENRSKGGKQGGKMVTGQAKRAAGSKGGKASSRKGVPNK
jgi:5-methylcytosine-specific restriction endonuclease McrA